MNRLTVDLAAVALNDRIPVIGIQLGKRFAPDDPARVFRDGDDVLDYHILGMHIEKVSPVDQALQARGDNLEVGPHRGVPVHVSRRHARTLRRGTDTRLPPDSPNVHSVRIIDFSRSVLGEDKSVP
jgi:hypothetical protein